MMKGGNLPRGSRGPSQEASDRDTKPIHVAPHHGMLGVWADRISITAPTAAERYSLTLTTACCAAGAEKQSQEDHNLHPLNAHDTVRLLPVSTGSPDTPRKGLPERGKFPIQTKETVNTDRSASNAALQRTGKDV